MENLTKINLLTISGTDSDLLRVSSLKPKSDYSLELIDNFIKLLIAEKKEHIFNHIIVQWEMGRSKELEVLIEKFIDFKNANENSIMVGISLLNFVGLLKKLNEIEATKAIADDMLNQLKKTDNVNVSLKYLGF